MATIKNNRSSLTTDPLRNFRFLVHFYPLDPTTRGVPGGIIDNSTGSQAKYAPIGFTSVSGLSVQTDSIPYREGGYNTTFHQIPGQTTFAPVSFQRGVVLGTSQNWDWMRRLFSTVQGGPAAPNIGANNFRCNIEIEVLSHPISGAGSEDGSSARDHVAQRFMIYNAWITSLAYSDLNAGDNAIFVEQMTVVHEGFDARWGTGLPPASATDPTIGSAPKFEFAPRA